jgi:hypothetical protein
MIFQHNLILIFRLPHTGVGVYVKSTLTFHFQMPPVRMDYSAHCYLHRISQINLAHDVNRSRNSVVNVATGYELDDRGVEVRVPIESRILFSPLRPYQIWGPPPPIQRVSGFYPGGKEAGA